MFWAANALSIKMYFIELDNQGEKFSEIKSTKCDQMN